MISAMSLTYTGRNIFHLHQFAIGEPQRLGAQGTRRDSILGGGAIAEMSAGYE